jgi:hypothetical protein
LVASLNPVKRLSRVHPTQGGGWQG